MKWSLDALRTGGALSALHEHFARTIGRMAGEERAEVLLAAALVSRHVSSGHVCLDLRRLVQTPHLLGEDGTAVEVGGWPEYDAWLEALRASPLVGANGEARPLVLDSAGRLYLRRYWEHQERLARFLEARADCIDPSVDGAVLREGLDRLFPSAPAPGEVDWQRIAALLSVMRRLCVISGGPGTGKTSTVVKILVLLIEQSRCKGERPPGVTLLAPTGKAAVRLTEAIRRAKEDLPCAAEVKALLPEEASTIHRCLGSIDGSATNFRHHAGAPLATDVVIVDEASMVDLALMARLAEAVPERARLILLGDKDQLASVEAGAVLGDICNIGSARRYSRALLERAHALTGDFLPFHTAVPKSGGIADCIVELTHSYRFEATRGIGALARAINDGDASRALDILESNEHPEVSRVEPSRDGRLGENLRRAVLDGFAPYLAAVTLAERLRVFEHFRVLCAHRQGFQAVETTNRLVERALADAGLLRIDGRIYVSRPVLVTRNDYQIGLFNGDVGLITAEADDPGARRAFFVAPDGTPRLLAPARLPPHETVFAMTIHKSQGSEFDEVAVLLPQHLSPVVSRELLYTAITRARRQVTLHATCEVVEQAIGRRIERASGLREALWD